MPRLPETERVASLGETEGKGDSYTESWETD